MKYGQLLNAPFHGSAPLEVNIMWSFSALDNNA